MTAASCAVDPASASDDAEHLQRIRGSLDVLPVAAFLTDGDGRIVACNARAGDLLGWTCPVPGESAGNPFRLAVRRVLNSGAARHATEASLERPDGSRLRVLLHLDPVRDHSGRTIGTVGCLHDITARWQADFERRERERQFHEVLEALPAAVYTTDAEGVLTFYNAAAAELWGERPLLGEARWSGAWRLFQPGGAPLPHERSALAAAIREARPLRNQVAIAERRDGTRITFASHPSPLLDHDGHVAGAVDVLVDLTQQQQNEARLELLAREVDHRAKNMLAVVQSLIRLTRAPSVAEFAEIIGGRVMALARAHILLSDSRWSGADLAVLAADELALHRDLGRSRIEIDGPNVVLGAPAAQAVAMVLHELTTNAVKFGALAGDHGRLRLRWTRDAAGGLDLLWQEQGGLATVADASIDETRGFGLSLIESAVRRQLCGSVETQRRPGGVEVRIRVPAEELSRS